MCFLAACSSQDSLQSATAQACAIVDPTATLHRAMYELVRAARRGGRLVCPTRWVRGVPRFKIRSGSHKDPRSGSLPMLWGARSGKQRLLQYPWRVTAEDSDVVLSRRSEERVTA